MWIHGSWRIARGHSLLVRGWWHHPGGHVTCPVRWRRVHGPASCCHLLHAVCLLRLDELFLVHAQLLVGGHAHLVATPHRGSLHGVGVSARLTLATPHGPSIGLPRAWQILT